MSPPPAEETIYLDARGEHVCAVVHRAVPAAATDTAVILCPPFGWDEVCSYRSRREWACRLADAGYAALRLSYPSTGDSGGDPRDPGRLDAWTDAVAAGASWLRSATAARHVVAVGIELGGLIAYRATAAGAAIDDLVLWATPSRGRALIRQLKAFSAMELTQFFEGLEPPPPLPEGELQAGGFLLSAETVNALQALNLAELPLPDAAARRVLLLGRDGIEADAALVEQLEAWGMTVTTDRGEGYAAMTSHPQRAVAPAEVIARVTEWLNEASAKAGPDLASERPVAPAARSSAELTVGDTGIRETPLTIEQSFGRLTAIVAEPLGSAQSELCAVLLNAGAVRRSGPNRMWVETARRWAARGVRTVRFDVEGIGDADGETTPYPQNGSLYAPKLVVQVAATLDQLSERGLGTSFMLVGLCAGAYWSLQLALEDARIAAAVMVNPIQLVFDPNRGAARDFRALFSQRLSWSKLRRNATPQRLRALLGWLISEPLRMLRRIRGAAPDTDPVDQLLERLRLSGKPAVFVFSDQEPMRRDLERSGALARLEQWDNVSVGYVPVRDHTLRPYDSQLRASALLDRALDRELGRGAQAQLAGRG